MQKRFLQRVWGDQPGWVFLACKGGQEGEFTQRAFLYPGQLDLLINEAKQLNRWADVWFSAHLFTQDRRRKENSKDIVALWIDKDKGLVEELDPRPSICWQTSKDKYQAVWLLKSPVDPERAEAANRYLTYKCNGDKGGWALTKILRLPNTVNFKYSPPQEGFILWDDGPVYDIEELEPEHPESIQEGTEKITRKIPKHLPSYSSVLQQYGRNFSSPIWDLLNAKPKTGESWSENLWRLERLLVEARVPPKAIFVVARECPWNKYKRDERPEEDLWEEVKKAFREGEPSQQETNTLPWVGMNTLLFHSEKPEWLVDNIWMQKNVGWIAGVGKSYKSTLTLDLALSVATGKRFLDKFSISDPGPVLMVQEEDPLWRVARRCQVMSQAKGITSIKISPEKTGLVLEVPPTTQIPLYFSVGGGFLFRDKEKLKALEASIDNFRPKLVIIDPWFMVTPGIDEFKSGEVTDALITLKDWRNKYDCAIAVVHHYTKRSNGVENRERLYGSMALYAWSENSLFVTRKEKTNSIVIERDIKDADFFKPLAVTFIDIDETYKFNLIDPDELREDMPEYKYTPESVGENRRDVEEALRVCKLGEFLTRQQLVEGVGVSGRIITEITKELSEEGRVEVKREGRGGQMRIFPTRSFLAEHREVGFTIND